MAIVKSRTRTRDCVRMCGRTKTWLVGVAYSTYVGNPFSNNLVNLDNGSDQLDWKKVSMKTLEGGEEAFGERGKIYGND